MRSREEALKALGNGKTLHSKTTGFYYRRIKGRLHRNTQNVEDRSAKSAWAPSCLSFSEPPSWQNMKIARKET